MIKFNVSRNTLILRSILNSSFEEKKDFFINNYISYVNVVTSQDQCYYARALNYAILMTTIRLIKEQNQLNYKFEYNKSVGDLYRALPLKIINVELLLFNNRNVDEQKYKRYLEAFILYRLNALQHNKVFFNFDNADYGVSVGKILLLEQKYESSSLEISKRLLISTPSNILLTLNLIDEQESLNYTYKNILNLLITYMLRYEIEQDEIFRAR